MSSTTVSSALPSGTGCGSTLYDTPVKDVACAMPYGGNHTDIMSACCKDAQVVSYYDNCGLFCLALDQTVDDLTDCLFDHGAARQDVFCRGNTTATATGTGPVDLPATASASVISSAASKSDDDDDKKTTATGTDADATGTSTSKSSKSSSTSSAASPGMKAQSGVNTLGLAIGALLFSATAFGAFQL
ncbi:hypothetical protein G7046_g8531 [Stylonectria norvegica]|nr:hypothetical protein G7046_g8531 [Stylonectria norvegica]